MEPAATKDNRVLIDKDDLKRLEERANGQHNKFEIAMLAAMNRMADAMERQADAAEKQARIFGQLMAKEQAKDAME